MDVTLRPATPADLDALVHLLGVLFTLEADFRPEPERQRRGLALLLAEPARAAVVVAERAGEVVGMATAQLVVSTAQGAPSAWVEDVVVAEAARGRGIGGRLLDALEAWARARGATRLQLLADLENAPALGFYAGRGWSRTQLLALRRLL